jgi:TATA-box binding protein (TBP) (component of TFIID and TFIIIB)
MTYINKIHITKQQMDCSIDDEWSKFIAFQAGNGLNSTNQTYSAVSYNKPKLGDNPSCNVLGDIDENITAQCAPECEDLYISTTTKVLFLNQSIDIYKVFWNIPIIDYWQPTSGIIKKQIKIVSNTPEEFAEYKSKLQNISYYNENIIKQINNPSARRLKFKDERKITVGLSKKDIMNCRGKVKNAFYNCFAIVIRFKLDGVFREMHVKVFNTGKMEIPGVINEEILSRIKDSIIQLIQPYVTDRLEIVQTNDESNILINSNFNCGFYINRDALHSILRSSKYCIETSYDPCSYPGVKCKFYYNNQLSMDDPLQNGQILVEDRGMKMSEIGYNKKYTEVSFMIFRTGSCLIVGNCSEPVLQHVFRFIKNVLQEEYSSIYVPTNDQPIKIKKTKLRKRTIIFTAEE